MFLNKKSRRLPFGNTIYLGIPLIIFSLNNASGNHSTNCDHNYNENAHEYNDPMGSGHPPTIYTLSRKIPKMENDPVVIPSIENHTATIIFMHDYAENEEWWQLEMFQLRQPYMRVVLPLANTRRISWKKNNLTSWFNVGGKKKPRINVVTNDLQESANFIHSLIRKEIELGIPAERIIIAGIHQGAMLALHSALTYPVKLGGIVALSPWHPIPTFEFDQNIYKPSYNIPIYLANVDGNTFTTPSLQDEIKEQMLKHFSKNVTVKRYEGRGRFTDYNEFYDAAVFCKKCVGPTYVE